MYRLTPRMHQHLQADLRKYHDLFTGKRCSGWELEELVVRAIQSDTRAQHHVRWQEAGHDDLADIRVTTNGTTHPIQIKSGSIAKGVMTLSGHRLGRFEGDFHAITRYLNANRANILSVPYRQTNDEQGRKHIYRVCYIDIQNLTGLIHNEWIEHGTHFYQVNRVGVHFSIRPGMSWQIWWKIPESLIDCMGEFAIG